MSDGYKKKSHFILNNEITFHWHNWTGIWTGSSLALNSGPMKVDWKNAVAHPSLKWYFFFNCVTNMHTKQGLSVMDYNLKLPSRVS